jgi:hypothetical protein
MSEYNFSKIEGTLVYVQVQEPVKAYAKPGTPNKPDEWKASVVLVDEDYVDELEAYGKSLDTLLSIKKVKSSEFPEKYKCDLPEGAGKNVWILTFRKSTELGKTGKPVPPQFHPKVYQKIKNTMVDITNTVLVSNGSTGVISIDKFDRSSGGSSLYLKNILVKNLIEYEKKASEYEAGSEFDDDSADDGEGNSVKVPASAKVSKPAVKAKPKQQEDDESELSF